MKSKLVLCVLVLVLALAGLVLMKASPRSAPGAVVAATTAPGDAGSASPSSSAPPSEVGNARATIEDTVPDGEPITEAVEAPRAGAPDVAGSMRQRLWLDHVEPLAEKLMSGTLTPSEVEQVALEVLTGVTLAEGVESDGTTSYALFETEGYGMAVLLTRPSATDSFELQLTMPKPTGAWDAEDATASTLSLQFDVDASANVTACRALVQNVLPGGPAFCEKYAGRAVPDYGAVLSATGSSVTWRPVTTRIDENDGELSESFRMQPTQERRG